jgi:hypothetical protein
MARIVPVRNGGLQDRNQPLQASVGKETDFLGKKMKTPVQVGVDFGRCERRDIVHKASPLQV